MLSVQSDGGQFHESSRLDQLVWAGCCTTSVVSPAGRSLSRSGEDGLSIPTGCIVWNTFIWISSELMQVN